MFLPGQWVRCTVSVGWRCRDDRIGKMRGDCCPVVGGRCGC